MMTTTKAASNESDGRMTACDDEATTNQRTATMATAMATRWDTMTMTMGMATGNDDDDGATTTTTTIARRQR